MQTINFGGQTIEVEADTFYQAVNKVLYDFADLSKNISEEEFKDVLHSGENSGKSCENVKNLEWLRERWVELINTHELSDDDSEEEFDKDIQNNRACRMGTCEDVDDEYDEYDEYEEESDNEMESTVQSKSRNIAVIITLLQKRSKGEEFGKKEEFLGSLKSLEMSIQFAAPEALSEMWQRLGLVCNQYIAPLEKDNYQFAKDCSEIVVGN